MLCSRLISKDFLVSSQAPYHWKKELHKKVTTEYVHQLLINKKFNHFRYNGAGSGCLTWTTRLIKVLEEEGILPHGSLTEFNERVETVRKDPKYWVPNETGAEFYD
jgi:hypothetical protein